MILRQQRDRSPLRHLRCVQPYQTEHNHGRESNPCLPLKRGPHSPLCYHGSYIPQNIAPQQCRSTTGPYPKKEERSIRHRTVPQPLNDGVRYHTCILPVKHTIKIFSPPRFPRRTRRRFQPLYHIWALPRTRTLYAVSQAYMRDAISNSQMARWPEEKSKPKLKGCRVGGASGASWFGLPFPIPKRGAGAVFMLINIA